MDGPAAGLAGPRLPNFRDQENLLYVERGCGLVKQILRMQALVPEDGEFHGYRLPEGSIILPSIAWFGADPKVYKDLEEFRPERLPRTGCGAQSAGVLLRVRKASLSRAQVGGRQLVSNDCAESGRAGDWQGGGWGDGPGD